MTATVLDTINPLSSSPQDGKSPVSNFKEEIASEERRLLLMQVQIAGSRLNVGRIMKRGIGHGPSSSPLSELLFLPKLEPFAGSRCLVDSTTVQYQKCKKIAFYEVIVAYNLPFWF